MSYEALMAAGLIGNLYSAEQTMAANQINLDYQRQESARKEQIALQMYQRQEDMAAEAEAAERERLAPTLNRLSAIAARNPSMMTGSQQIALDENRSAINESVRGSGFEGKRGFLRALEDRGQGKLRGNFQDINANQSMQADLSLPGATGGLNNITAQKMSVGNAAASIPMQSINADNAMARDAMNTDAAGRASQWNNINSGISTLAQIDAADRRQQKNDSMMMALINK